MPTPEVAAPEAPADCPLCPRLVAYREANKISVPGGFNGAVGSFGDEDARLCVVGLAPGRMAPTGRAGRSPAMARAGCCTKPC